MDVPWTRLIRFISAKDSQVYYGDVILPSSDFDIGKLENQELLRAKVITGNPLSSDCKVTEQIHKVQKLFGPLTPQTVPAVRCIGGNYAAHLKEFNAKPSRFPIVFPKVPYSVCGHGEDVEIPAIAQDDQADYEGELTIVIGRDAKNVSEEDALNYVLGYTVADDVSARKWQMDPEFVGTFPPPQMSFSKSFDQFCPMGPCIVSSSIIKDPSALVLSTKVNGELRQSSPTSDMVFTIQQIIAFCSQGTTLQAGSVILTGSPPGIGFLMNPKRFLVPGDKVEINVDKIGTLVHGVSFA